METQRFTTLKWDRIQFNLSYSNEHLYYSNLEWPIAIWGSFSAQSRDKTRIWESKHEKHLQHEKVLCSNWFSIFHVDNFASFTTFYPNSLRLHHGREFFFLPLNAKGSWFFQVLSFRIFLAFVGTSIWSIIGISGDRITW